MAQREGRGRTERRPIRPSVADGGGRDPVGGAFIAIASVLFGGVVGYGAGAVLLP